MKTILRNLTLCTLLLSTTTWANDTSCSKENAIATGIIGVLQGVIIGGPIGAFWGFGAVVLSDNYADNCQEQNLNQVTEIKTDTVSPKKLDEEKIKETSETPQVDTKKVVQTATVIDTDNKLDKIDKMNQTTKSASKSLENKFVNYPSFVNFAYDSYKVNKFNTPLNSIDFNNAEKITIQGHTDSKGTDEYNFALGLKRANAVKKILEKSDSSLSSKINIISYGESTPISSDDAKNRRVDLEIQY